MRPTVEEQLLGTCRILEETVAPEVANAHASEVLRGLIANLRMLNAALPGLTPFLLWDNEATSALLASADTAVPAEMSAAIRSVLVAPADSSDPAVLGERNEELRDLLSRILDDGRPSDDWMRQARSHLAERSARSPIRYATPLPAARKS